jgi:hypothetical protein
MANYIKQIYKTNLLNDRKSLPQDVIGKIAKKYNLPDHIIEYIIRSEFAFVYHSIVKKEFKNVRLHYLGVFGIAEKRKQKIIERKALKDATIGSN